MTIDKDTLSQLAVEAIVILAPNASWSMSDWDYANLQWDDDDIAKPTEAAFNAKLEELKAAQPIKELRAKRNELLAETDYWDASDTPAMSQAQIDYRQALRDITDTYTSLDTVVWPTKP